MTEYEMFKEWARLNGHFFLAYENADGEPHGSEATWAYRAFKAGMRKGILMAAVTSAAQPLSRIEGSPEGTMPRPDRHDAPTRDA